MNQRLHRLRQTIKTRGTLLYSSVSLAALLVALALCGVILADDVFCWFAPNSQVSAQNASVRLADIGITAEYGLCGTDETGARTPPEEWTMLSPADELLLTVTPLCPGDSMTFQLRFTNTGIQDRTLSGMGFLAPEKDVDEIPRVIPEGTPIPSGTYYFGSQLTAELLSAKFGEDEEITSPTPTDPLPRLCDGSGAASDLNLLAGLLTDSGVNRDLPVGETVTFTVRVTFVNDEENTQDMYKLFGQLEGESCNCSRRLFLAFE